MASSLALALFEHQTFVCHYDIHPGHWLGLCGSVYCTPAEDVTDVWETIAMEARRLVYWQPSRWHCKDSRIYGVRYERARIPASACAWAPSVCLLDECDMIEYYHSARLCGCANVSNSVTEEPEIDYICCPSGLLFTVPVARRPVGPWENSVSYPCFANGYSDMEIKLNMTLQTPYSGFSFPRPFSLGHGPAPLPPPTAAARARILEGAHPGCEPEVVD